MSPSRPAPSAANRPRRVPVPDGRTYRSGKAVGTVLLFVALVFAACSDDSPAADAPDAGASNVPGETTTDGATTGGAATGGDPTLGEDMIRLQGTITTGRADAASDGTIPGPFTLQVPSPGGGNGAVFNPVSVDGVAGSIVWDGGRPLTLSGPALHFDGTFDLGAGTVAFDLSQAVVALAPGSYDLVGPVAVGDPSGLPHPADAVTFVAGPDAGILGTGRSSLTIGSDVVLLGPGSVDVTGTFTVVTAQGSTTATSIHIAEQSFELTVSAAGDGTVSVSGLARGAGWA